MNSTKSTPPKKPSRQWLTCLVALVACIGIPPFLLFLLFAWILIVQSIPGPPLVISEETTRITGPLTDAGYIDFFKALEERFPAPELATDDNGYRDFVRLFGDVSYSGKPEYREFSRLQLYEKLGLDPDIPPTMTFPQNPRSIVENFGLDFWYENYWTLGQFPMLVDWIDEIDEPLDAIAEALRKPVFVRPLLWCPESVHLRKSLFMTFAMTFSDFTLFIDLLHLFSARAAYRIGIGDIDGAIDDKLSLHRLGRIATQRGTHFQYRLGTLIDGRMATAIAVGANPMYPLTQEQLRRLTEGLDSLPSRGSLNDSFEWKRYIVLSFLQSFVAVFNRDDIDFERNDIAFEQDGEHFFEFLYALRWLPFLPKSRTMDWNSAFRSVNELFDAIQEPPPRESLRRIRESLPEISSGLELAVYVFVHSLSPYAIERILTEQLIVLVTPPESDFERIQHSECVSNMHRLALAIMLYRFEHGTMPDENWATQIKPYLGNNPEQYFSCPCQRPPEGWTTYLLVLYGDVAPTAHDTILLAKFAKPVPFNEATVTVDQMVEVMQLSGYSLDTARQSGVVQTICLPIDEEELLRLLGRAIAE